MQHRYIQWDSNENCAIFFQDTNYNPISILSSNLLNKVNVLEFFEYYFLLICGKSIGISRWELDTLMLIDAYHIDNLDDTLSPNPPKPTYISEYINIVGQLFLAGYIDFGSYCDDEDRDKIDYPENLSYYKEDKYQAWIYFRDNFFYANAFNKSDDDDIMIYEGKEYSTKDCPTYFNTETKRKKYCGYSTMYSDTSWDTPKYWSQYNIWVAQTEKGTKYFNEILAPRFYNKYKDLEVEIDEKGNIIKWIGKINR